MKMLKLLVNSCDPTTAAILSVFTFGAFAVLYVLLDEETDGTGKPS